MRGTEPLHDSPLFDKRWYEHQAGRRFVSRKRAISHFRGHPDLSPHPLFNSAWVFPDGWQGRGPDPLTAFLEDPGLRASGSTHPLLDVERMSAAGPPADHRALGLVERWIEDCSRREPLPSPRGAIRQFLVELRTRIQAQQSASTSAVGSATLRPPEIRPGRVSVVVALPGNARGSVAWALALAREHPDLDLEVLVVAAGTPAERAMLRDTLASVPQGRVIWTPRAAWPAAAEIAASQASGESTVVLRPGIKPPYWPWVGPLVESLRAQAVAAAQPLLLDQERVIASAGASFVHGRPDRTPLLGGLASSDAARLADRRVPAVTHAWAMRTALLRDLGPWDHQRDPSLVATELSLRAWRHGHGASVIAPASRLVMPRSIPLRGEVSPGPVPGGSEEAWARAGYDVQLGTTDESPGDLSISARPLVRVHHTTPALRWTIDIAAPEEPWGRAWGDHAFAHSLATALERLGQRVTVDSRESRSRTSRRLDDVVLVLRGRDVVYPPLPTGRPDAPAYIMWVISNPESIGRNEVAAYDHVFAASRSWARERSSAWNLRIRPLPQCTDARRFQPHPSLAGSGPEVLFVGNARRGIRPAVSAALAAGLRPVVYGAYWGGLIPEDLLLGHHVDNERLSALYASAGVVLNDHAPEMRRHGFVSNRVFDVVASAGRLVSDDVSGLEMFRGSVVAADSPTAIAEVVRRADHYFDPPQARLELAGQIRRRHSFLQRADVLLDAAAAARTRRRDGPSR